MNKILFCLALIFIVNTAFGQGVYWNSLPQTVFLQESEDRIFEPEVAVAFSLNMEPFLQRLKASPIEFTAHGTIIQIPMPDGKLRAFEFFESPMMQPGLQAKYPDIRTFSARAIDNHAIRGRFDITYEGFHGYVLGMGSPVIIDPIFRGNNQLYQVFFRKDLLDRENPETAFICDVESDFDAPVFDNTKPKDIQLSPETDAITLRTYRLVIATTHEYSTKFGTTKAIVMAEVVKAVNRVNSIVERDFALRYELVTGTDELFFLESDDPYSNGNTSAMIMENPIAVSQEFTFGQYDIGHVFGTSGGGLAQLSSVCGGGKARGVTSAGGNNGDDFYVDYVAHEMGHQMGSNHTFNNCSGFAGGNENPGTAYEPGSGGTIMSYSGICGQNNIQFASEPFYHVSSLREITNFMIKGGGNSCGQKTLTENHYPVATIPISAGFSIPISTGFKLNGVGVDEDGDSMTYSWEQWNLGPISNIGSPIENAPLFFYVAPSEKTYRLFPMLSSMFSGVQDDREVLPTYSRDLDFQFVVRDNHPGGGAAVWTKISFEATDAAGPFIVTKPGLADKEWIVGAYAEVTWNVANTDKQPVNCQSVNIRLLHGQDYDNSILLAQNLPNTGIAYIEVPDMVNTGYRVMVEAADNIFLDLSNSSHAIVAPTEPLLSAGLSATGLKVCTPASEEVMVNVVGLGGYSETVSLSLDGDWDEGALISLESTTLNPGESTKLILDFENITNFDPIDIEIAIKGAGMDTLKMDLHIDLFNFDYAALATVSPADGENGVSIFPTLNWAEVPDFELFHVQVASSPTFEPETILLDKLNATGQSLVSTAALEANTVYYWRIKTKNNCGQTPWSSPSSFSTVYVNCNSVAASDLPISISGNNPGTVTSVINIASSGTVSDLNITNLTGNHKFFGDISLKIIAPSGESAKLITKKCANTSAEFNWTFDDASTQISPCILDGIVKPEEPLSIFTGLNTQGDWTLEITDDVVGSGGKITGWNIELCSDASLNLPQLINNKTLEIQAGQTKNIPNNLLLVEDVDNSPEELKYTLVQTPQDGDLKLDGNSLEVGMEFTQADIADGKLFYQNFSSTETQDSFYFSVFDGAGGLIPVTKYEIAITPVGLGLVESKDFTIFPNPTSDMVNIEFAEAMKGEVSVEVLDVTSRVLFSLGNKSNNKIQFSTKNLKAGIYFVRMLQDDRKTVAKITVLK